MLVRLSPDAALKTATLTVFYESFKQAGPFGPDLKVPHKVKLKPAHYSLEAAAAGYQTETHRPHPPPRSCNATRIKESTGIPRHAFRRTSTAARIDRTV